MGVRLGFGAGPFHVSTRVGGKPSPDDDVAGMLLVAIVGVAAFFGFAPWAAVQALTGRWGVTPAILGAVFVAASVWSLLKPIAGVLFGTSWGLYASYLLGYWTLVGHLPKWGNHIDPTRMHGLDGYVVAVLFLIAVVVELLIVLAIPTMCSFFVAYQLVRVIAKLQGREASSLRTLWD